MSWLLLLRDFLRRRPYGSACALLIVLLIAANHLLWQERAAAIVRHELARQQGDQMLRALADHPRITAELAASLFPATAPLRAADPSPAPPAGKGRLTEHIDALLRPHRQPVPLPVVLPNPFIVRRGTVDFTECTNPPPLRPRFPLRPPAIPPRSLMRSCSPATCPG